jgi:hypothetical protein
LVQVVSVSLQFGGSVSAKDMMGMDKNSISRYFIFFSC